MRALHQFRYGEHGVAEFAVSMGMTFDSPKLRDLTNITNLIAFHAALKIVGICVTTNISTLWARALD